MKRLIIVTILISGIICLANAQSFEIRGVLPWHNFLSGPSAWNEKDYEKYLNECQSLGLNFLAFHCYTGGGERYATYVEPMIKISYRNILPTAFFDNSMTSRWGYLPVAIDDFAFGTDSIPGLPGGAKAFGADCSTLSLTTEEHYKHSQELMSRVIDMAHDRDIKVAIGFEFGVLPPEYFSLNPGPDRFYWLGEANMLPNPAHETAIELLYVTIDNILATYPEIDWMGLWLNEHCFMGVDLQKALENTAFKKLYDQEGHYFEGVEDLNTRFIGVWSLQYIRLAYDYIQKKAPQVKVFLSGWGGSNQLPVILQGLNKALPADITFSCLNPDLGKSVQPEFLSEIAKNRSCWAIPWLEGDHQLWHLQPRINLMREHVGKAAEQGLQGVLAIHWRTEEVQLNMEAFAFFANQPESNQTTTGIYSDFLKKYCGSKAAGELTSLLSEMDILQWHNNVASPEFYSFTPEWGQLDSLNVIKLQQIKDAISKVLKKEKDETFRDNLLWLQQTIEFELLLDQVCRSMQPAWDLRKKVIENNSVVSETDRIAVWQTLEAAPVEKMFRIFAEKARSRGELGILSSLNQKLWTNYTALQDFFNKGDSYK